MKILKIFGLVVGIHAVGLVLVFAIPGCRSTTSRHSPPPPASVQAEKTPGAAAALNAAPPPPTTSPFVSAPIAPASETLTPSSVAASSSATATPMNFASSAPVVRFNPTRPGTPAATALQTAAPSDMTPASTYTVASGDTLSKIAKKNGLTVKELASANHLKPEAPLKPGHKLLIPGKATPTSTGRSQTGPSMGETLTYKVKQGDTLQSIAKRAETTPAAIRSLNRLSSDSVKPGQELILPAGGSSVMPSPTLEAETVATPPKANASDVRHTVKPGESLDQIAKRYGVTRRDIAVKNNITDPKKLRPGQELVIPGVKNSPANSTASATPPTSRTNVAPASPTPEASPASAPANPISAPIESSPIAPSSGASSGASPIAPPIVPIEDSSNPVSGTR